jgi:hypothetical protein
MKRLLLLTLLGIAAACSDQPLTTEPSATSALSPKTTLAAQAPDRQADLVADAVDRIAPVFGESAGAVNARSALRALEAKLAAGDAAGVSAAVPAIENALDRIERDEPGHAADVAAIRLAIAAL